jgi:transposase
MRKNQNYSLSWDQVDGIMQRAVQRGLKRCEKSHPEHIGIDETSFQKQHEYVTVILDKDTDSVIDVLDYRRSKTLEQWFAQQQTSDFTQVKSITMDMWDPFIKAVRSHFENAQNMISFDRFHVVSHFAKALDKVRASEHRELAGTSPLYRSKHQWLRNSDRTDNRVLRRRKFMILTKLNLRTARAWRIKEAASMLWNYTYMGVAQKRWKQLLGWISRCRLKPMIAAGKTVRRYLWGILNAIRFKVNNSMLEAKNTRIQRIKNIACGFRNKERFKTAILFHLGKLDMAPSPTR